MHPVTLSVTLAQGGTQSVRGGIPTQSVGTIGQDLASVQALAGQLAFDVDGPLRDAVLGIHRMVEGIQLMVDRVRDLHEVSTATAN
ncbi:hypothetical protein BMH52_03035 [Pseudomonas sp. BTN1]|nr:MULTISPECIES: hypothetical protein [unclassified Pseudomonas]OKO49923.1 hypothetical protein BMH52_03035 [Pseudomonas sp. BTN1]SFY14284.1 hypothetical protein SAMN03159316_3822 [Pseudomonas sp. NFR02]